MATGYARQSSGSIVTAATIEAAHFNNEYNAIEAAFDETTGHNHDGTTDGGAKITPAALAGVDGNGIIARTTSSNFEARTLTAPAAGITVTNGDGVSGNPTLVLADDLAGVEGLSSTGLAARTGSGTWSVRTLTAPAAGISVANGDGVSGNPTLSLANDLSAYEGLSSTGVVVRTGDGTATTRSITAPAAGITVTNGDGVAGAPTLALANDLAAYEGLAANGLVARTGDGTASARTIAAPAAGITIADGDGVAGNPTLSLANDLSGLEGLSGTGLAVRTGTSTWTNRTITASLGVAVTNGDGVSAAPAFTLDVNGLTADASPDAAADYVATYDASAATHKKVLLNSISPAASTSTAGIAELLTDAETLTRTDTTRVPTASNLAYLLQNTIPRSQNILCAHKNLIVKYINATTVDVDADEVVLVDTSGNLQRFASLNESPAITASGANGLDTGAEGSSTWYHVWAIGKSDGTLDSLISASATAPTLPSGYTFQGYLGAVYNNSSSNFVAFFQRGNFVTSLETVALNGGTATSFTAISLAAIIPPNATSVLILFNAKKLSGTAATTTAVAPAGSATTPTYGELFASSPATADLQYGNGELILSTAQEIVYYVSGANAATSVWVEGWRY